MRFMSQGSTDGDCTLPDEDSTDVMEVDCEAPGELAAEYGNAVEEVPV